MVAQRGAGDAATVQDVAQASGDYMRGQMLPDRPTDAVVQVMRLIARDDVLTCILFTEPAAAEFAAAHQAFDCRAAVHGARSGITDPDRYGDPIDMAPIRVVALADGSVKADGCAVGWRSRVGDTAPLDHGRPPAAHAAPGPALGMLRAAQIPGTSGWIVVEFTTCQP